MKKTTYAISKQDGVYAVQATPDGFGAFKTRKEAAARIVELAGIELERARKSLRDAKLILRAGITLKQKAALQELSADPNGVDIAVIGKSTAKALEALGLVEIEEKIRRVFVLPAGKMELEL